MWSHERANLIAIILTLSSFVSPTIKCLKIISKINFSKFFNFAKWVGIIHFGSTFLWSTIHALNHTNFNGNLHKSYYRREKNSIRLSTILWKFEIQFEVHFNSNGKQFQRATMFESVHTEHTEMRQYMWACKGFESTEGNQFVCGSD